MTDWNYRSFWDESLSQLKSELGDEEYGVWFSKLEYIRAEEAVVYASAPSNFFLEMFNPKYLPHLVTKMEGLTGKKLKIVMEVPKRKGGTRDISSPLAPAEDSKSPRAEPKPRTEGNPPADKNTQTEKKKPPTAPGRVCL